jgi:hypothetical protein
VRDIVLVIVCFALFLFGLFLFGITGEVSAWQGVVFFGGILSIALAFAIPLSWPSRFD